MELRDKLDQLAEENDSLKSKLESARINTSLTEKVHKQADGCFPWLAVRPALGSDVCATPFPTPSRSDLVPRPRVGVSFCDG
jgi:hypothetical protein